MKNEPSKKQTALVAVDAPQPKEEKRPSYWSRVASRYLLTMRLCLVVLVLFVVLFMVFFSRAFTYNSLFGFFKDIQSIRAFVPSDFEAVTASYREGEELSLSFRGGIAFVNCAGVEIYSPDGKLLLDAEHKLEAPRAVASRKYLLVFDHGKNDFWVMNAYDELYHGQTDRPIYGAEMSDSGQFALITEPGEPTEQRAEPALSRVELYDSNFYPIYAFNRAFSTVDVAISENGKQIAFFGTNVREGEPLAQLALYDVGETEPSSVLSLSGEMPLSVGFVGNKRLALLTDRSLLVTDGECEIEEQFELGEAKPVDFCVTKSGVSLLLQATSMDSAGRIVALDEKGKLLYDTTVSGRVDAISHIDDTLFALLDGELICVDLKKGIASNKAITGGAKGLFAVSKNGVRVIYPAMAEYIEFE